MDTSVIENNKTKSAIKLLQQNIYLTQIYEAKSFFICYLLIYSHFAYFHFDIRIPIFKTPLGDATYISLHCSTTSPTTNDIR